MTDERDEFREQQTTRKSGDDSNSGREAKRRGDIRLRSAAGTVIDHSLPLHEAIEDQWRKGELSRVDDDDMPWQGDEYDVSGALERRDRESWETSGDPHDNLGEDDIDREDGDAAENGENGTPTPATVFGGTGTDGQGTSQEQPAKMTDAAGEPQRPADNAPKKAWQDYAVAIGAVGADDAAGMTRQQLADRSTPPELKPEGL